MVCAVKTHTLIIKFLPLKFGQKMRNFCFNLKNFLLKHFFSSYNFVQQTMTCIATITRKIQKVKIGSFNKIFGKSLNSHFSVLQKCGHASHSVPTVSKYTFVAHSYAYTYILRICIQNANIKHSNRNKQALKFLPVYYG